MLEKIAVTYTAASLKNQAEQLAAALKLTVIDHKNSADYPALLIVTPQRLELFLGEGAAAGTLYVDFLSTATLHRYRHGGGRQQLLARAVGLHKKKNLTICDISAGLGRDAFVLASLGAQVTMLERSPIIGALLQDGWRRAQQEDWIRALTWQYAITDSREYLQQLSAGQYPQVIYFDPMFPERKKSALVKKEMRILREIAGDDLDAEALLSLALQIATDRVVVKRPRLAESLPGASPSFKLEGQSSRFDIYLLCKK